MSKKAIFKNYTWELSTHEHHIWNMQVYAINCPN